MSVLVTGGAGFIGSHVVDALVKLGKRVVVYDSLEYCAHLGHVNCHATFIKGDILDGAYLSKVLLDYGVTSVMHFAAQSHVDKSFSNSIDFTTTNILGTHTLLEAMRKYGKIEKFIHVSTDEVYGDNNTDSPFYEHRVLMPTNPYAASKVGAEALVHSYATSFGIPTIITRSNNIYGPRQYPEKIVPKFIIRGMYGKTLTVHGDGSHRRMFLYISDVVRAFMVIFKNGELGETYNIGCESEYTTSDVACIMKKYFPRSQIEYVRDRAFNDTRYLVNDAKLRALGWAPRMPFEKGLIQTIKWYESYNPWDTVQLSEAIRPHPV